MKEVRQVISEWRPSAREDQSTAVRRPGHSDRFSQHTVPRGPSNHRRDVDWPRFVNLWRAEYFANTSEADDSTGEWVTVHSVYREALRKLLARESIELSDAEQEELTTAWKFLDRGPTLSPA